jgi:hypothetical protein
MPDGNQVRFVVFSPSTILASPNSTLSSSSRFAEFRLFATQSAVLRTKEDVNVSSARCIDNTFLDPTSNPVDNEHNNARSNKYDL